MTAGPLVTETVQEDMRPKVEEGSIDLPETCALWPACIAMIISFPKHLINLTYTVVWRELGQYHGSPVKVSFDRESQPWLW